MILQRRIPFSVIAAFAAMALLSCPVFAQGMQIETGVVTQSPPSQQENPPVPPVVIEKPLPEGQIVQKIITPPPSDTDTAIRKQADADISARADEVSDECDAHFGARIDWTTIAPQEIRLANPANTCGAVLDALEQICSTSDGRARIAPTVKSIVCTAGRPPALSIHSGTLVYTLDWQSANPAAFAYAWIAAHL